MSLLWRTSRTPALTRQGATSLGLGFRRLSKQVVPRHFYDERVKPFAVACHVRRPDEVLAGDIEVALGRPIVVRVEGLANTTRLRQVGHHWRHSEDVGWIAPVVEIETEAHNLVAVRVSTRWHGIAATRELVAARHSRLCVGM